MIHLPPSTHPHKTAEEVVKAGVNTYRHIHINEKDGDSAMGGKAAVRILMVKLGVYDAFCGALRDSNEELPGVSDED